MIIFWKLIGDFTTKNSSHNKILKIISEEKIELNINSHKNIANNFNVDFSNIAKNLFKKIKDYKKDMAKKIIEVQKNCRENLKKLIS